MSPASPSLPPLIRTPLDEAVALLALDGQVVRGTLVAPRGCDGSQTFLAPWLK